MPLIAVSVMPTAAILILNGSIVFMVSLLEAGNIERFCYFEATTNIKVAMMNGSFAKRLELQATATALTHSLVGHTTRLCMMPQQRGGVISPFQFKLCLHNSFCIQCEKRLGNAPAFELPPPPLVAEEELKSLS